MVFPGQGRRKNFGEQKFLKKGGLWGEKLTGKNSPIIY
jgi:hypothetical protein